MHSVTTTPNHRSEFRSGFRSDRHWSAATVVIGILAVAMLAGCRSSRPGGSTVQVTEEPAAVAATLPAPEQRLATAKMGKPQSATKTGRTTEMFAETSGEKTAASGEKLATASNKTTTASSDSTAPIAGSIEGQMVSQRRTATPQTATKPVVPASTDGDQTDPQRIEQAVAAEAGSAPPATSTVSKASSEPVSSPEGMTADGKELAKSKSAEDTVGNLVSASLTDLSTPTATGTKPRVDQPAEASPRVTAAGRGRQAPGSSPSVSADGPSVSADGPSVSAYGPTGVADGTPAGSNSPDAKADAVDGSAEATREPGRRKTGKPNALDTALTESLDNLPSLPASVRPEKEGPRPTRIAAALDDRDSQLADSKSDREPSIAMNADRVKPVSHADGAESSASKPANRRQPGSVEDTASLAEWTDQQLYKELLTRVSAIGESDGATERERRQIIARHLMVLAGDPDSAVAAMEGLNPDEQLYLKNQLLGLWTLIDPQGHPSSGRRITEALPQYRRAVRHMAAATDSLALDSLEFCTEIEAYGQIKPFSGNRFNAGQQVIVYCEVENFSAAEREGGFQTRLQGSYDIYDESGTKVFSQLLPLDEQRSRNHLRDYFVAYQMNLPKQLPPGTYRLQLTVEDLVGKKYGQANIPFDIR